jgi:hypothetical protein
MENWILNKEIGNVSAREKEVKNLAEKLFMEITALPKEVRSDEKERTGISVFIAVKRSDNYIRFNIGTPSDRAIRYAQRKAEMLEFANIYTTRAWENPEKAIWAGGIATEGWIGEKENETNPNQHWLLVGVSGLKSEEDETIAIILIATILKVNPKELLQAMIYHEISENITEKGHYLCEIIEKYS